MLIWIGLALIFYAYFVQWVVLIRKLKKEKEITSYIPFVFGLIGVFLMGSSDSEILRRYSWIALFLDWGSFPGIATSLFLLVRKR